MHCVLIEHYSYRQICRSTHERLILIAYIRGRHALISEEVWLNSDHFKQASYKLLGKSKVYVCGAKTFFLGVIHNFISFHIKYQTL
jgi:hypothetical protein